MSEAELRQAILETLAERGPLAYYQVQQAISADHHMVSVWVKLEDEGQIEPTTRRDAYDTTYRLRPQMRLL